MYVLDVDSEGTLQKIEALSPDGSGNPQIEEHSPIDIDVGPDGVLYVLYTGGIGYSGFAGFGRFWPVLPGRPH